MCLLFVTNHVSFILRRLFPLGLLLRPFSRLPLLHVSIRPSRWCQLSRLSCPPVFRFVCPPKMTSSRGTRAWGGARDHGTHCAAMISQEEHPLDGANVSFESIDTREGKPWWQCMVCVPDVSFGHLNVARKNTCVVLVEARPN